MALDRALLERMGQLLREGTMPGCTNLTKPELLEFAATARALAAGAEAEINARSAPFPASLPPWLVMQWLPLRDVAAALRVARSWRDESEQYFRRVAQHHGLLRGDSWRDSVECYVEWYRHPIFTSFQRFVFSYYAKRWVESDERFIPIEEVVAVTERKYLTVITARTIGQVKTAVAFLVSKDKLTASSTGRGHRCELQVEGLEALTPLQQRVLKYHIVSLSDGGRGFYEVTSDLGIDINTLRTTVDFLKSPGHLESRAPWLDGRGRGLKHWATRATTTIWPLQRRVLDYYTQHATSDVGIAMNTVAASLGVDLARVRAAVAFLVRRGYLCSTIDDDHHKFKSTTG